MEDINKSFFENMLKKYEKDDSITISSISEEPAVGKGENFMSIASRIKIQGKRLENNKITDFSRTIFMKKPFTSEATQEMFQTAKIFTNEALAYNEIIPALEKCTNTTMPVGRCLFADVEKIILEDLTESGYNMFQQKRSLTLDEAAAVLKALAKIHSASIVLKNSNPQQFQTLTENITELFSSENVIFQKFMEDGIAGNITILQKEETEEVKILIKKLENVKDTIFKKIVQLLTEKTDTDVINHGDCWMNNILFKKNSEGISVKLVDLQIMRYTSVAADLSYFLYINLHPKAREENQSYLLDIYLSNVHANLRKHNLEELIKIYNKKWLKEEMERFAYFGMLFGMALMSIFYSNKENLPDMNALTIEDIESDELQEKMRQNIDPEFKNTLILFLSLFFKNR